MTLGKVGLIGRFKPLHNGAAVMLEAVCRQAEKVIIGIGSANKYNMRNPFTAAETREMLEAYLSPRFSNYEIVEIPDYAHEPAYRDGMRWVREVHETFGELDHFASGNAYVKELLSETYDVLDAPSLVPREHWIRLRGSEVRARIAGFGEWRELVPEEVADYLDSHGLVDRFRREFGLATIVDAASADYTLPEEKRVEYEHTLEA